MTTESQLRAALERALPILRRAAAAEPRDALSGYRSPAAIAVDAAEHALGIPNDNPPGPTFAESAAAFSAAVPGAVANINAAAVLLEGAATRLEMLRGLANSVYRQDLPKDIRGHVQEAYRALEHAQNHAATLGPDALHLAESNARAALAEVKAHDDNRTR